MADYYSSFYSRPGEGELPPDLLTKTGANLRGMLAGELSPDVQNLLAQRAAEIGVASGTGGSEFNKFRSLRDLGLTSLDRMDAATKMLAPEFISPSQSVQFRQRGQGPPGNYTSLPGGGWGLPSQTPTSAPLVQPRAGSAAPTPSSGRFGLPSPEAGINQIIDELGQKYGLGAGVGMAPMGQGTIPSYGGSWNAGPLDVGGGSFFAGSPEEMSTEEQWQYGMVPGLTPAEQAQYSTPQPSFGSNEEALLSALGPDQSQQYLEAVYGG